MVLIKTLDLLRKVRSSGGCVGAFNVVDYLSMEAVVAAAEKSGCPAIIQTSSGTLKRFGVERTADLVRVAAEKSSAQLALHLDHGTDPDMIKRAIRAGFHSVMIDASSFPFEENIQKTREIVEDAHQFGVSVEGEIGVVAGVEDDLVVQEDDALYTTPDEALEFIEKSQVDFLAAAIGTAHGFYRKKPRLNIDTLRDLFAQTICPLVVHGGTGLDRDTIQELVRAGASKFNVSTQIKIDYIDSLFRSIGNLRDEYNILKVLQQAKDDLTEMFESYMILLSNNQKTKKADS